MKTTLTIIAMLISCICYGQKEDSVGITLGNGLTVISSKDLPDSVRSILLSTWAVPANQVVTIKPDTLRVLMLICDTSNAYPRTTILYYTPFAAAMQEGRGVWWQFGYEARGFGYGLLWPPKELTYLDECKRPISKSLVVWISKTINHE